MAQQTAPGGEQGGRLQRVEEHPRGGLGGRQDVREEAEPGQQGETGTDEYPAVNGTAARSVGDEGHVAVPFRRRAPDGRGP